MNQRAIITVMVTRNNFDIEISWQPPCLCTVELKVDICSRDGPHNLELKLNKIYSASYGGLKSIGMIFEAKF